VQALLINVLTIAKLLIIQYLKKVSFVLLICDGHGVENGVLNVKTTTFLYLIIKQFEVFIC